VKARLESTGMPLAVAPDAEFPVAGPVKLAPGDIVLLTTDGVHDAVSPAGMAYGSDRFLEAVRAHRAKTAGEIIHHLYRDVCEFSHREKPADDVTLVVIKVESCPAEEPAAAASAESSVRSSALAIPAATPIAATP
jgi:sigma-B regulation protein RsbU (phosphoserine phosphatase)